MEPFWSWSSAGHTGKLFVHYLFDKSRLNWDFCTSKVNEWASIALVQYWISILLCTINNYFNFALFNIYWFTINVLGPDNGMTAILGNFDVKINNIFNELNCCLHCLSIVRKSSDESIDSFSGKCLLIYLKYITLLLIIERFQNLTILSGWKQRHQRMDSCN